MSWRFRSTRVGFYGDGRLFSMTSPKEFLTFPLLRPHERARLAAFVARCADRGLKLVGEVDLDDGRRASAAAREEDGAFGLALLTFRVTPQAAPPRD